MTVDLERHLQQRQSNHTWLAPLLEEGPPSHFPYRPAASGEGRLEQHEVVPLTQPNGVPTLKNTTDNTPLYLINLPHVPNLTDAAPIQQLLGKVRDETFGSATITSRLHAIKRVAVVIGMNRISSLDQEKDRAFVRYVRNLPAVGAVPYRIIGKLWSPYWTRTAGRDASTYPPKKAFLLLKTVKPAAAATVLSTYEKTALFRSQIPYQRIREWIKNSAASARFELHYRSQRPNAPRYLLLLDDDTKSLRVGTGVLSRYDALIAAEKRDQGSWPHLLSTGYAAAAEEKPIYRLGIKLDMAVRAAMAVIPNAPYYPEPNLLVLLHGHHPLRGLSFLGAGNGLEGRRLIQNGIASGQISPSRMRFVGSGGVVTTVPDRMRTDGNEAVVALSRDLLARKSTLKALRGLSQTHLFAKNWADNLYLALPIKAAVTSVTKHLMVLFRTFDPISLSYLYPTTQGKRFSAKQYRELMQLYPDLVEEILHPQNPRAMAQTLRQELDTAKQALRALGLSQEWTDRCVAAAEATGREVHRVLQDYQP